MSLDRITFFVPGPPIGKESVRKGSHGWYIPAKTRNYMDLVSWHAREAMRAREPFQGPLRMSFRAVFSIPKSWSQEKRRAFGSHYHTSKPDVDNIHKAIGDACNKIVWDDDAQVCAGEHLKEYGEKPGVRIIIEELT